MKTKIKLLVAVMIFTIGAIMAVTPYFTLEHFELLIPGVILIGISTPFMYYWYAKVKSRHEHITDEEILRQAKIESQVSKEINHAKK